MSNITIIGSGLSGLTVAYYAKQAGHQITIFEQSKYIHNLAELKAEGSIHVIDKVSYGGYDYHSLLPGSQSVDLITDDLAIALNNTDIIIMNIASFAQKEVFALLMPYLQDGQIVVSLFGNLSSLVFKQMLDKSNNKKNIIFAESFIQVSIASLSKTTFSIISRSHEFFMEIGVFPAKYSSYVAEKFKFKVILLENIIASALSNDHSILHVPFLVLNMGVFETFDGDICGFRNGMSPAVCRVMEAVDSERIAVAAKYGAKLETFVEYYNRCFNIKNASITTIRDFAENTEFIDLLPIVFPGKYPRSPQSRFITDDVPYLMVPIHELGKLAGVATPIIDSLIHLASTYNSIDYFTTGRTLAELGIQDRIITL
jgi:opine dehydrogenase